MRPQTLTPFPTPAGGLEKLPEAHPAWLPFPAPVDSPPAPAPAPVLSPFPAWPAAAPAPSPQFAAAWPALCALPSAPPASPARTSAAAPPISTTAFPPPAATIPFPALVPPAAIHIPFPNPGPEDVAPAPPHPEPRPAASAPPAPAPPAVEPAAPAPAPTADFTDDDLTDAFGPIVEEAVRKAIFARENGMDTYLEPMLRATIRRALAEYTPSTRPFQPPGAWDRLLWHFQALFTSRTYQDILFEKTHRFQVEEVFLVDAQSLALVSFASCDPARHASARRVSSTIQRIALQLKDEDGNFRATFRLPDQRHAIARQGRFVTLVAIVRGQPNDLILSDLEFSLRRIEDRFRSRFQEQGSALLHPLQPFLEDCLLIQAPASAA